MLDLSACRFAACTDKGGLPCRLVAQRASPHLEKHYNQRKLCRRPRCLKYGRQPPCSAGAALVHAAASSSIQPSPRPLHGAEGSLSQLILPSDLSAKKRELAPPPTAGRRWFLSSTAAATALLPLQKSQPLQAQLQGSGPLSKSSWAWWVLPSASADAGPHSGSGTDLSDIGEANRTPPTPSQSASGQQQQSSDPGIVAPSTTAPTAPTDSPALNRSVKRSQQRNSTKSTVDQSNLTGSREPGRGLQQQVQEQEFGDGCGGAGSRSGKPLALVGKVQLASGLMISKVVKGCLQLDGRHRGEPVTDRTSGGPAIRDFEDFVRAGITTFDTADTYNNSEGIIGQYLRLFPWRRQEVQVLTKVTFLGDDMRTINRDLLEYRVRAALLRSGTNQLDLVQLHWGDFYVPGFRDVALWLGDLQQQGMIRHIGVTNFDVPHLLELLDTGLPIVSNQVQFSVLDRRPLLYMAPLCERRGVKLLAYGTLAGGLICKRSLGLAAREARLDTPSKSKYGQILQQLGGWSHMQEVLEALQRVATRHHVSISAVATRWVLQQQAVAAVLVGARNSRHCRELRVSAAPDWELDDGDMLELDAVAEGVGTPPTGDVYAWERGGQW